MAYLTTEQIGALLADLGGRESDAGLIAEVCLATGARWGEAEKLLPRQVGWRPLAGIFEKKRKKESREGGASEKMKLDESWAEGGFWWF
jgi:integrase